jgi:hypothetical protein
MEATVATSVVGRPRPRSRCDHDHDHDHVHDHDHDHDHDGRLDPRAPTPILCVLCVLGG